MNLVVYRMRWNSAGACRSKSSNSSSAKLKLSRSVAPRPPCDGHTVTSIPSPKEAPLLLLFFPLLLLLLLLPFAPTLA